MMNQKDQYDEESIFELKDEIGSALLDCFQTQEMMTESAVSRIKSLTNIQHNTTEMLNEAKMTSDKQGVTVPPADVYVSFQNFLTVWKSYEEYPDAEAVWRALGFRLETMPNPNSESFTKELDRIREQYLRANPSLTKADIPSLSKRPSFYGKQKPQGDSGKTEKPTKDDIHPGDKNTVNKTTLTLDRINSQEILNGEFYATRSRIPRQRWAGWLRFWDRRKTSVRPNNDSKWAKYFLMGYQIERDLLFEIWFNTLDSTYSIYDRNGVEVGRPIETLQETMRYFTTQIAQYSDQDSDFFSVGGMNNKVANSMMRGIAGELSKHSSQAKREEQLKSLETDRLKDERRGERLAYVDHNRKKQKAGLKAKDIKGVVDKAASLPTNLGTAAYIKMGETASSMKEKYSASMHAALEAAIQKGKNTATDDAKLAAFMFNKMKEYMGESYASSREDYEAIKQFIKDERIKARVNKEFYAEEERKEMERRQAQQDRFAAAEKRSQELKAQRAKEQEEEREKEAERMAAKQDKEKTKKPMGKSLDDIMKQKKERPADIEKERKSREAIKRAEDRQKKNRDNPDKPDQLDFFQEAYADDAPYEDNVSPITTSQDEAELFVKSKKRDQEIQGIRNMAERSPYTQAAISGIVLSDLLKTYNESRIIKNLTGSRLTRWFRNLHAVTPASRELPTDPKPYKDSIRQNLTGKRSRADFVIGYSLNDKVNMEIWYVSEPDPNGGMMSSFYVYDVSSAKAIRKYIPYYRNAVTVVLGKVGLTV